jgi:hypothetical protein
MSLRKAGKNPHRTRTGLKAKPITCGELGEDWLLHQLLPRLSLAKGVVNRPGDDCALVETFNHQRRTR